MQAVKLVLVLRFLCQQAVHQRDNFHNARLQYPFRDLIQLPLDVAQHATRVALETAQCLAHPFELASVSIAADLTGQPGCEAVVVLSQPDSGLAGQPDQLAPCRLIQPGIRRVGDVFLHHRGIDRDPLEIVALHCPGTFPGLNRLGQHPFDTFLANPLAPSRHGRRVNWQTVLKERLAAEMLPIRVLGPSRHDRLIRERKSMLKIQKPRHKTRRGGGAAGVGGEESCPFPFENIPVNQGSELHQLMAHVDHFDQSGAYA